MKESSGVGIDEHLKGLVLDQFLLLLGNIPLVAAVQLEAPSLSELAPLAEMIRVRRS